MLRRTLVALVAVLTLPTLQAADGDVHLQVEGSAQCVPHARHDPRLDVVHVEDCVPTEDIPNTPFRIAYDGPSGGTSNALQVQWSGGAASYLALVVAEEVEEGWRIDIRGVGNPWACNGGGSGANITLLCVLPARPTTVSGNLPAVSYTNGVGAGVGSVCRRACGASI